MKSYQIICTFLLASFFFSASGNAQIIDSLPWFKAPSSWDGTGGLKLNAAYDLNPNDLSLRSLKTSGDIQILPNVTTLKLGKECFQVIAPTNRTCRSTKLFWRDGNRDGKIQPKLELKSECLRERKIGTLRAKKAPCK